MDIFDKKEYGVEDYNNMFYEDLLFFDIETATEVKNYNELSEAKQKAWAKSAPRAFKNLCIDKDGELKPDYLEISYREKGMLQAEYNKVICISIGRIIDKKLKIISISLNDGDEKYIVQKFAEGLLKNPGLKLVGYNIAYFDVHILFKKMIQYKIKIPEQMKIHKMKPWEIEDHIKDIFLFWKGGRFDSFPSFSLVCDFLGIKTPKEIMDGSQVGPYFWGEKNVSQKEAIDLISKYCNDDVKATAKMYLYLAEQGLY